MGLGHVRLQASDHVMTVIVQWHRDETVEVFFHDLADATNGRIADRAVIQLGFAQALGQVEFASGPDWPGVHFLYRLQRRDTPAFGLPSDRPVQGAGAAVADNSGMNDHHRAPRVAP